MLFDKIKLTNNIDLTLAGILRQDLFEQLRMFTSMTNLLTKKLSI